MVYDGMPISSGGAHGLGRVAARDAVSSWIGFLEVCTAASPIKCWFQFPETPGLKVDPQVVRAVGQAFAPSRSARRTTHRRCSLSCQGLD